MKDADRKRNKNTKIEKNQTYKKRQIGIQANNFNITRQHNTKKFFLHTYIRKNGLQIENKVCY